MASELIHGDALAPRQQSSKTLPIFTFSSSVSGVTGFVGPSPTATSTATRETTSASTSTSAAAAATGDTGMPLGTKLALIIGPIAAVIILVPIIYLCWVRHRTRNMKKLDSEPRHSPSPLKESKIRLQSPTQQTAKPALLPPLFHDHSPTKEGSLFDDVRVSMESTRRNESGGLFDRARDDHRTKDSSYNVYALRRSLEDKGRTDSIGLFDLPRTNTDRSSPSLQPQRGPSPTLPSPKVPLFDRPPSETWPLPASKLPSPPTLNDPYLDTKPLPVTGLSSQPPPQDAPLSAPRGHGQHSQTNSYASSSILPLQQTQEYRPSSPSGRPQVDPMSNQHKGGNSHDSSTSSNYASPVQSTFNPLSLGEHTRGRQRDSDIVSELSYRSPSSDRDPKRRSTDAISVVSAISHRKRRSERDTDTLSMVSALSPEQEDTPRIPIEHYPRT